MTNNMKNKLIKIISMIVLTYFIIQPYYVFASILKQEISSEGVTTYYVATHEENKLALNMIKARMETNSRIIYTGNISKDGYFYLDDVSIYDESPQSYVSNTGYGIGTDYSDSLITNYIKPDGTFCVSYTSYYNQTKEQTKYIYEKIHSAIIEDMDNLKTDYQKANWAYEWILNNIYYDTSYANKSPYYGLINKGTICTGYASLYCAITNELGLESIYISGTVGDDKTGHAWNATKLNGKWYCVDTTFGDSSSANDYFLKSKDTLLTNEYGQHDSSLYDNYKNKGEVFSLTDYDDTSLSEIHGVLPSVYNIKMDILKMNLIRKGEVYNFMISNQNNIPIYFKSSNPNVALINKNGSIIGVNAGTTVITAYNTNLNIEQNCIIVVK